VSATISTPARRRWLTQWLSGLPHQVIGDPDAPYLLRWFIIPRNRFCNIYWHRFLASDHPTPHSHPWDFASIILGGSYFEESPGQPTRQRRRGHIALRRASHIHCVRLARGVDGAELPATTLIVTGPWLRPWGFWCDGGGRFVPWQDFGPGGCGEETDPQR